MADLSLFGSAEFQEETPLEAVSPNMPIQFDPEADIKDIVPAVQGNLDQLGSNDVSTLSADVAPNPLINSRELTHGMDPVRTSKVLTLSRESGLPPRVVEQHVDEMERRRTISDEKLDLIQNQYPQTAQLLSDPDFFAVAQDDIDRLTALEGTIRQYNPGAWERIGTKWEESRQQLEDGVRGFALGALSSYVQLADEEEAGGFVPNSGVKALRELARGALAHVQAKHDVEKAKRTAPLLPAENNLQQYVEDFVGASAPILATMAITALTRSPYAGSAFMATQIAGGDYLARKEQGASDVAAFSSGLADAALQAPLEALSLGKFFNIFKATGGAQILKTVATALGTEFTTEFLQKFPEDLTEDLALIDVRGQDVWDALGGFMDNLDETAKAGLYEGLLSAPWALLGGAGQVVRDYSNMRATEQEQTILDSLTQDIAQTNLAQLDPVLHQQALQILASGSQIENVFIDSQAFEAAYGPDVAGQAQVLDSLGISQEAYQNAVATGEELTVQLGNYASTVAAFPEFANKLANDRKLSKQGLTRNEWLQTQQELAKTYQDILIQSQEEVQAATQEDAETKTIFKQVYAARQAAGRVPDAARLDAAQFTAALVSMAKMSEGKYTPTQLFEAYMPQVRAGQPAVDEQTLQQDAAYAGVENEAEVEEAARLWAEMGTESPYFKRWFGESKVVDDSGKPLVVYHGTEARMGSDFAFETGRKTKRYTTFSEQDVESQGMFFSPSQEDAESYGGNVGAFYLSAQNPLVNPNDIALSSTSPQAEKDAAAKVWDDLFYIMEPSVYEADGGRYIDFNGGISRTAFDEKGDWIDKVFSDGQMEWDHLDNPEVVRRMKERGYDSVKVYEQNDQSGYSWFVTDPTQIKSATGNRGTFDPADARIQYQTLSTRLPSAVKAMEDPLNEVLTLDFNVALSDTKTLEKNMQALLATPNMRKPKGKGAKTPAKQAELFIDHVVSNLLFLHDAMDPDMRSRAKLWYDGGRKTIETWAERYGISEMQGAALIAVLSPQNPWFANVSQAERIADIVFGMRDFAWSKEMDAEATRITKEEDIKSVTLMDAARGKTLGELLDQPHIAARWLRVYDQTHNNRSYRILTPEGGASGFVQTNKGADGTLTWNGFRDIAKAISVLVDGRAENIYYQIGLEHKVRNFYNNLFDPKSPLGFVTIDTHAVAAAMLRPLAGGDLEVLQAFGGGGASSSSFTGLNGTYPLYAEAYCRAAEARGLLPREMQSITWEAVRGLFEASKKSGMKPAAAAIWERYKAGEIEQEQAQQEIFELVGGVTPPSWSSVPYTDEVQRTYTGPAQERIDARGPAGSFVLSAEPTAEEADKVLSASGLPLLSKSDIDQYNEDRNSGADVNKEVILSDWEGDSTGVLSKPVYVQDPTGETLGILRTLMYGDWENLGRGLLVIDADGQEVGFYPAGKTDSDGFRVFFEVAPDPNDAALTAEWNALPQDAKQDISQQVAAVMVPKVLAEIGASGSMDLQLGGYMGATNPSLALVLDRPELLTSAAKLLGYALAQDSMMVVSDRQSVGTQPTGAVTIDLPDGYGAKEVEALYDRLWELEQDGEKLVGGHTTANGHMVILNFSNIDTKALADIIDRHLGGEFVVADNEVFSAFINKETYQYGSSQQQTTARRTPVQGRAGNLRNEATRLLREALDARGTQTLFQLAPVRGGGPQILRAGDVGRVRANYGEQKAGGSSVLGIHYSREPRESLSGHFYGTGIKGSEARRLALSSDPRLSQRIHFYVDTGEGIRPEPGVGSNIHAVNLNNVYNVDEDPLGLVAAAYADKMADPNVSFNNLESAIIDAGFDGIFVPRAQATKGVVVLLGDHAAVPVDLVQRQTLNQFAGPRAATADQFQLATAQEQIAAGADTEMVRRETGWFQGVDGKWRFEINDSEAKLERKKDGSTIVDFFFPGHPEGSKLYLLLDHPALFAAYPWLEDVKVASSPVLTGQGKVAAFDPYKNEILVSDKLDFSEEKFLPLLLHEIQHAIQKHEGLASGGDFFSDPNYRNLYGEIEARNVEARRMMSAEERASVAPGSTQDVSDAEAIVVLGSGVQLAAPRSITQQQGEPQAAFTFKTKSGKPLIELFRTANQSSFLHETGHLYLEMMRELALAPNAPAPVTALWAQTKAALKIDDGPISREAHEEWARNLEAYFLEGAAPSLGLRKIFAQYAQWLRSIYKQVEQIFLQSGTQFNEDLKPIFDRIFATEKDIEEARSFYSSQKPFFAAVDPKVMAKEREKYEERRMRARESMEDKRLRQLTEAWVKVSGGKGKIRAEVAEEVKARPVMAVIKAAAAGIDMKALDATGGEDLRKQLKAIGRYSSLVKKEGTVDPDILAAENGYDSAVAMVEDLISFPGEKAAITAGVEARMEAERQRISRGLAETDLAADEAYHNDDQLAVLVAEFEILSQQAAQKTKRLEASMVRDVAKQLLASEKVNFATQSSRFARLERRAAKLARAAYERGDAKAAAEYKRQEVLNHAMFIESVKLKEGVAKTAARIKRGIQKTKGISPEVKTLLQGLGIQYGILPYKKERDPVRAFEMWNQDLVAKGGKIPTIEGWVDEMRKLGISAPLDPFLNNAAAVPYQQITVGQFRALEEGVRILRRVDRGLHTVTWIDGSTITMEDAIERLQAHVAGRGGKAPDPLTYDPNAVTLAARNFFAEHTKTSTIIQALDNWEAGGLFYQLIYRPVMDADSDLSARWATEAPKIKALFEPIRRQLRKKVVVLGKARPRAQLVAAALNVGNQGNRERLIAGLGINEAQLDQLLAPLTTEEMDFVQAVWDYIATFKDEAFAVERRLTGREPAAVDPVPFEFKGKTYAGGYYPVSYDKNLRDQKGEARDAKEALDELFGGTPAGTAMTAHGHLEARASAGTGERLSQELSVISDHVAQVLRDITHREAVVNVAKLLKNKQIMAMITDVVGREKAKQLWPWLVSVSKEGREQIQLTAVEKMLLHFRPAMTFYTQAYKVGTALMQAAGFFQVFEFVKPGHVGQAVWQLYGKGLLSLNMFSDGEIISHPLIKEIREKSPQMNERLLNADRDIRDATKEFSTSESALATYKKAGFKATVAMQFYVADVVAWQGAYLQALTDGMTEKDAINRADFVVEQAMGAGYTRALSKIQRGGSIQRFLTMFYTFGSVLYNLAARRAGITKKQLASGQYGAAALGASSFLVLQWVMPVLLEALVRGDAADDDDDETLAEKLLLNLLTYPAQSVLIARELSGIAKGFKYRFSPALKPFESVGQWISSVARAIEQEDASIAAKPTAQLVGTTTGLIPAQFINSGEVLTDYLTGEDQELSVKELLYGKRRQ